MIQLQKVSKTYYTGSESVRALKNIDLEINKGEFVVIVGPSGSGKSTLLHLIAGLDKPTKGKIIVEEKDINSLSDADLSDYRNKKIGVVFQDFKLHPDLTIHENIQIPLMFNKGNKYDRIKAQKRAADILKEVAIHTRINHKPSQISGGQKQRAAIARALIMDPEIILADEPTGNLDSQTGAEIIKQLKQIHKKRGNILIVVTHDKNIAKHATRIIEIQDGDLKEKNHFNKFMQ